MKNYERPIVMLNDDLAEGVYANSGECYTVEAEILQGPDQPNKLDYYVIEISGTHVTDHHSGQRIFRITFNKNVYHKESMAAVVNGSGTNVLELTYGMNNGSYHHNGDPGTNFELADLKVTCEGDVGLSITGISCIYCSEICGQH